MTEREKLYDLIVDAENEFYKNNHCADDSKRIECVVEYLIAHGVTVKEPQKPLTAEGAKGMKKPEETKRGLLACTEWVMPADVQHAVMVSALALIQQLEAQNAELVRKTDKLQSSMGQVEKALQDNGFGSLEEFLRAFSQVKRERDAAVADIHKTCSTCKHYYYNRQDDGTEDCPWFDGCKIEDHWEWRGVPEKEGENNV